MRETLTVTGGVRIPLEAVLRITHTHADVCRECPFTWLNLRYSRETLSWPAHLIGPTSPQNTTSREKKPLGQVLRPIFHSAMDLYIYNIQT